MLKDFPLINDDIRVKLERIMIYRNLLRIDFIIHFSDDEYLLIKKITKLYPTFPNENKDYVEVLYKSKDLDLLIDKVKIYYDWLNEYKSIAKRDAPDFIQIKKEKGI